jgi:16S rRNA (guanine527-N7)-methyltransferase
VTEEEARGWIAHHVPRETISLLERYVAALLAEAQSQNLIALSTAGTIWGRHIVDSAQLLRLAPQRSQGGWVDIGAGAGLPGLVIAIMSDWKVTLVESRRKRITFLQEMIEFLNLQNCSVAGVAVEKLTLSAPAAIISARAFAPLPRLFETSGHLGDKRSFWLLPKGKSWQGELDAAQREWDGSFHVEHSLTDAASAIIIAHGLRRKGRR